jgi:RNA polymerase sigma-70 factor (ECF subfamily)
LSATLATAFLSSLDRTRGEEARRTRDLETTLRALVETAQAVCTGVRVDARAFVGHVAAHLPTDEPLDAALHAIRAPDLYVAFACGQGEARAIAELERSALRTVPAALGRMRMRGAEVEEIQQIVRDKLLVGQGGAPPRIMTYAGRGPLEAWVRVVAVREALSHKRRKSGAPMPDDDARLAAVASGGANAELALVRGRYAKEFGAAFREALGSLVPDERNLLRLHFVDGLNIDAIGAIHRVHRSTVARRIARVRGALLARTRERLVARVPVTPSKFTALFADLESHLSLSLSGVLRPDQ